MHRAAPVPQLADRLPEGTELPRGLQDLIEQAMAKSPSDRFQSAIELAEAIDAVANGAESGAVVSRISEARRLVGHAPTVLDLSDAAVLVTPPSRLRAGRRGGFFGSLILLAILVGGVGAAVLWIKGRSGSKVVSALGPAPEPTASATPGLGDRVDRPAGSATESSATGPGATGPGGTGPAATGTAASGSAATGAPAPASAGPGAAGAAGSGGAAGQDSPVAPGSAGPREAAGSAGPPQTAGSAVAVGVAAASGSAEPGPAPPAGEPVAAGSAAPAGEGSGDRAEPPVAVLPDGDIEMDPEKADDPAPPSTRPANGAEEAANAPKTAEEIERHERERRSPAAPPLATTVKAAVRLIQDGKHDLAMASLRELWKKEPGQRVHPVPARQPVLRPALVDRGDGPLRPGDQEERAVPLEPDPEPQRDQHAGERQDLRKAQGFLKFTVGEAGGPVPPVRRPARRQQPGPPDIGLARCATCERAPTALGSDQRDPRESGRFRPQAP